MQYTMKIRKKHAAFAVIIIIVLAIAGYVFYVNNLRFDYTDSGELTDLTDDLDAKIPNIKTTDQLMKLITDWADYAKVHYTKDDAGNIIFTKKASHQNSDKADTTVCIEMNALTSMKDDEKTNGYLYAMGEYLALHGLSDGDVNVLFLNNRDNLHEGARKVSSKFFSKGTNVINLTADSSTSISRNSFASNTQSVTIPYSKQTRSCDSGLVLHIGGIVSGNPGSSIGSQPNPITALDTVLTRLKSKSISFELANVKVESKGNMYPTGIEATILFNSYAQESVTTYLDERAKKYKDDYEDDFPDIDYSYKLIEDSSSLPDTVYSDRTTDILSTFLYTVKNGTYRFDDDDTIPEDYEKGDIYGINCIEDLSVKNGSMNVTLNTVALDDQYMKQILSENRDAATLSKAKLKSVDSWGTFSNTSNKLFQSLEDSYSKFNDLNTRNATIREKPDVGSGPCKLFEQQNSGLDIVHIGVSSKNAVKIMNTLLNYLTINDPILRL